MFNLFTKFLKYIYENFLDLIYNKKCLICGCSKQDELLCKTCAKDIEYLSTYPHKIYENIPVYSVCLYKDTIKALIHKLKFNHRKSVSKVLAKMLFEYFKKIKDDSLEYIITFPPSFFLKSAQRGYNHMFLIAKEFSKLANIEINKNLIKKIKYTKPQYKVKDRRKNIKDSFKINIGDFNLKNKTILILDDIITSGATLEEIINCFKKVNIDNIICLTVSKSVK